MFSLHYLMSQEVDIKLGDDLKINFLDLHKMAFLFNALEKAKSARTAMLFSRTNTLLSLPMLLTMVVAQNLY